MVYCECLFSKLYKYMYSILMYIKTEHKSMQHRVLLYIISSIFKDVILLMTPSEMRAFEHVHTHIRYIVRGTFTKT